MCLIKDNLYKNAHDNNSLGYVQNFRYLVGAFFKLLRDVHMYDPEVDK